MNPPIILNTVEDVFRELPIISEHPDIKRYRSHYLYRGLPNSKYDLRTSLERNCGGQQEKLEKCILRNFAKYASIIENPYLINSVWQQLIVGQHHGLPTRMLDWTCSSLVALHFAMAEESLKELDQHDCAIWAINVDEINDLLPADYKAILDKEQARMFTTDMLKNITLDKYDSDMGDKAFIILEPPSIDERIVNQYSYFSVMPTGIKDFEAFLKNKTSKSFQYIISKDIRWQLRDTLDNMNINERIMFPGYDGLCKWLKRYYFSRI